MNAIIRTELMVTFWDNVNFELIESIKKQRKENHNEGIRKKIHEKLIQLRYTKQPILIKIIKEEIKLLESNLL